MPYVDTIAFNTKSTARHGGDPGWIRHANGGIVTRPDDGVSGPEEIAEAASLATMIASLGKTFVDLRQQKIDTRDAKHAAGDAQAKADAAATAAVAATQAQTAAIQAQAKAGAGTQEHSQTKLLLIGSGVVGAVLLGAFFLLRRR